MSPTWRSDDVAPTRPLSLRDRLRALVRAIGLVLVLLIGVTLTAFLRLAERAVFGQRRPWTGWITVWVCRIAMVILRIRLVVVGTPMSLTGAHVANHSSWLDIFVLNAGAPLFFVSKAEVAGWPGIGGLARLTGTVFVRRARQEADAQRALLEGRLQASHRLLFFPEGTSTDGKRVLTFKATLFASLFSEDIAEAHAQPVTVAYTPPEGYDSRFYAWWGDMEFGPHLIQVLAAKGGGTAQVTWHTPFRVSDFTDRKQLAAACEAQVRRAHPHGDREV
ncbi:MAG: 1-acyl-sn-glycerol-3-phosphate acyltransferase [Pseudomonadota bacterium]